MNFLVVRHDFWWSRTTVRCERCLAAISLTVNVQYSLILAGTGPTILDQSINMSQYYIIFNRCTYRIIL